MLETAIESIFTRIEKENKNELSRRDLLELHSVFPGTTLPRALDILDRFTIIQYFSPDKSRSIIEVPSSQPPPQFYRFYPDVNYCPCPCFVHLVLKQRRLFTCKHQLAAKIALALSRTEKRYLGLKQFREILASIVQQAE